MMLKSYTLLLSAVHLIFCHPVTKDITLPRVNISNPYEINNLNYYNADTDPEPEESKLFRRTVTSNFENSVNYIDKTVKEVESLLNANSSLPRLTRGEILEIIQDITESDLAKEKELIANKTNGRDQKAIMLVMPYTPDNTDEGKMQELFTKPPITKMIGDAPKPTQVEVKPTVKRRRRPLPQVPQGGFYGEVFPEPLPERTIEKKPTKASEKKTIPNQHLLPPVQTQKPQIFTQRPLASTEKPKTTATIPLIAVNFKPLQPVSTTERIKRKRGSPRPQTTSTEISVIINKNPTTKIPQRKRRPSKSPQRHPNHKYPEESQSQAELINQGLKLVDPPKLSSVKPSSGYTTRTIEDFIFTTVAPAKSSRPHPFTAATNSLLPSINLPDDLKATLEDLNLGDSFDKKPLVYEPDVKPPPPLNDNVKDILASIGVLPSTTTSTSTIPDISNVADTLTPDMQQLLMSFGLLPDPNYKPAVVKDKTTIGTPTAEVNPNSYVQFKPLPESGPAGDDMEEFLGRFGLGKSSKNTRNYKALNINNKTEKVLSEVPHIQEEMVPAYMRDVLIDLGLTDRQGKKIRAQSFHKTVDKASEVEKTTTTTTTTTTEKQNVFSPLETSYDATKNDLEKLNQLLDIIRQLEKLNATITEKDLNKADLKNIKDLVGSLNKDQFVPLDQQKSAPNPLNDDYGVSKNEVKRQQNSTSTIEAVVTVTPEASTSTTSTTTTTTTTSTTTEASNIKALEDSFGGSSDSGPPATLPPPTQPPNTGFYYLLDWNTFLDIDDQKGKRVNLRFQPKAGDPKRFYSVNVP